MRAIIVLFLAGNFIFSPFLASAHNFTKHKYYFDGKLKTEVEFYDGQIIRLKVLANQEKKYSYPVGTVFTGHFISHKERRSFSLDEVEKYDLDTAKLPDGHILKLKNKKIKIKADGRFDDVYSIGRSSVSTAGFVLSLALDAFFLGLPVGRGGFALFYTIGALIEAPKCVSKFKEGVKGFMKGVLFPLPQIIGKGDKLNIHEKSIIHIGHEPFHNVYAKLKRFTKGLFLKDKEKYISAKLIIRSNQDYYQCEDHEKSI